MYTLHGKYNTPSHKSWVAMKQRCDNPKNPSYRWYGAIGITYPKKWETFQGFYEDMGERPKGTSLDRIDSSKNYSKKNCVWSDKYSQANNRSNNRVIEYRGEKKTLAQWCRELDINYKVVSARLNSKTKNWTVREAFQTPCRRYESIYK